MRLLLDHCVPRTFARFLPGHHIETTRKRNWDALSDGALLDVMQADFDALITVDRSLRWQQNIAMRPIFLVVMIAKTNTLSDLQPLASSVLGALQSASPGDVIVIGGPTP